MPFRNGLFPVLYGPNRKKIWIDLDNSPHVPFFHPIIRELKKEYQVIATARDCFQVCGLADLYKMEYLKIGRHYGKNVLFKFAGLLIRSLQLAPEVFWMKPDLALSHGSRSQLILSDLLGIPSLLIMDYEYSAHIEPTWLMLPEVIPASSINFNPDRILRYPGIKEDVYVPAFCPDPAIIEDLRLPANEVIVTVRPPATEAHYHNRKGEQLFVNCMEFLVRNMKMTKVVVLPRNERQERFIRQRWAGPLASGKLSIPAKVINGLNLIWHSDLVISGGGTINREAAALNVPVYSIFQGKIGAVDRYLAEKGRLTLVKDGSGLSRISLVKRNRSKRPSRNNSALGEIVGNIKSIVEGKRDYIKERSRFRIPVTISRVK